MLKYLVWVAPLRTPRADAALTIIRYARMCGLSAFGTARRFAAFALADEIAMIALGTAAEGERSGQRAALARKRDRIG